MSRQRVESLLFITKPELQEHLGKKKISDPQRKRMAPYYARYNLPQKIFPTMSTLQAIHAL